MKILSAMMIFIAVMGYIGFTSKEENPFTKYKKISFSSSKAFLNDHYPFNRTFYCGCEFYKTGRINRASCGYKVKSNVMRASRLEWEHVVPASRFGQMLPCWRNGGRSNCIKTSPAFRQFEADLHNLRPAIGEVNANRSNYHFGVVNRKSEFGSCQMKIDYSRRLVEPPDSVKGDVARITMYIHKKYDIPMEPEYMRILIIWALKDTSSKEEIYLNEFIRIQQGDKNSYIP